MVAYPIHTRRNTSFRIHGDQELCLRGDEMFQMQIKISYLLESAACRILGFYEIFRSWAFNSGSPTMYWKATRFNQSKGTILMNLRLLLKYENLILASFKSFNFHSISLVKIKAL